MRRMKASGQDVSFISKTYRWTELDERGKRGLQVRCPLSRTHRGSRGLVSSTSSPPAPELQRTGRLQVGGHRPAAAPAPYQGICGR